MCTLEYFDKVMFLLMSVHVFFLYSIFTHKSYVFFSYSGSSNITVVLQQMNNVTNEIVQLRNKFQVHTYVQLSVHVIYTAL